MSDLCIALAALVLIFGIGLLGWGFYVAHRAYVWGGMLLTCAALWIILGTVAVSSLLRLL